MRLALALLALVAFPMAAVGEDYLGGLKPPKSGLPAPAGVFSLESSGPANGFAPARLADSGFRLKLGYKYSRYFSVESQFVDFARAPGEVFSTPGNLASAFRATGFGVDTVATVPVWRSFSFYGRMGAYRGESANAFSTYSTALLSGTAARGTRWRYGLGMRYDFTPSLGVRAEVEHYSPLGSPLASDLEADQVSVGVSWRF
jgi:OOP family OmpA-OmpF porin